MDVRNNTPSLDTLLTQLVQTKKSTATRTTDAAGSVAPPIKAKNSVRQLDKVDLSNNQQINNNNEDAQKGFSPKQTRLTAETIEPLENGFRRSQEFGNANGRKFIRTEEFITQDDRSTRTVIQQNASGAVTVVENVIDRQDDGSFRLTERYTDEAGTTKTNITNNITPNNEDIILGRPPTPEQNENPFRPARGTQFDVTA